VEVDADLALLETLYGKTHVARIVLDKQDHYRPGSRRAVDHCLLLSARGTGNVNRNVVP
jgi:hypothetical protein